MHRTKIGVAAALMTVVVALAVGSAGATIPTTGSAITLNDCVASPCASTFPAGEPFWIGHGFTNESREFLVNPSTRFELEVDGEQAHSIVALDLIEPETGKLNVSNFRTGMAGVHTFVGCWYGEDVLVFCGTRTVTFTP